MQTSEVLLVMLRKLFLLVALGALASCAGTSLPDSNPETRSANKESAGLFAGLFNGTSTSQQDADPPTKGSRPRLPTPLAKAELAGGDIVVAGPDGYCVDPTTLQNRSQRGFAIIASCNILSAGRLGAPVAPMLVSVTIGPRGDQTDLPKPSQIAAAAGAPLLGAETSDEFVVAHLATGGEGYLSGGDMRHWRGAFVLNGRIVGLALYAPKGSALAASSGGDMLGRVKTRIAVQSGAGAAPIATAAKKPAEGSLLGRLFNR